MDKIRRPGFKSIQARIGGCARSRVVTILIRDRVYPPLYYVLKADPHLPRSMARTILCRQSMTALDDAVTFAPMNITTFAVFLLD